MANSVSTSDIFRVLVMAIRGKVCWGKYLVVGYSLEMLGEWKEEVLGIPVGPVGTLRVGSTTLKFFWSAWIP